MAATVDQSRRQTMFEVIGEFAKYPGTVDANTVITKTADKIGSRTDKILTRELLKYWGELVRSGAVCQGDANGSWNHSQFILTESGAKAVENASRDPSNASGYLAYLDQQSKISKTVRSYVEEALNTYCNCCYKATAILIGAATEGMILELRDEFLTRLKAAGKTIPNGLDAWQVKTITDAIISSDLLPDLLVEAKKNNDDKLRQLHEQASARLSPCAAEFRKTRNAAGHPAILDSIDTADVHANLLLFPSTVRMLCQLTNWVKTYY